MAFTDSSGESWIANFASGLGGLNVAIMHPDARRVLVVANGDMWIVDRDLRTADVSAVAIEAIWSIPGGIILSRQGLAFLRIGRAGIEWHTRRLSWDGFDQVRIEGSRLSAMAWSPLSDSWTPCSVDLLTGESEGGSFSCTDDECWELVAVRLEPEATPV